MVANVKGRISLFAHNSLTKGTEMKKNARFLPALALSAFSHSILLHSGVLHSSAGFCTSKTQVKPL